MKKLLISAIIAMGMAGAVSAEVHLAGCTGCHGTNFEKHALGKSRIVKDLNKTEIVTALKGYKDGTYNSAGMAGVMKGQIARYSDEQIKEISELISQDTNTTK